MNWAMGLLDVSRLRVSRVSQLAELGAPAAPRRQPGGASAATVPEAAVSHAEERSGEADIDAPGAAPAEMTDAGAGDGAAHWAGCWAGDSPLLAAAPWLPG